MVLLAMAGVSSFVLFFYFIGGRKRRYIHMYIYLLYIIYIYIFTIYLVCFSGKRVFRKYLFEVSRLHAVPLWARLGPRLGEAATR